MAVRDDIKKRFRKGGDLAPANFQTAEAPALVQPKQQAAAPATPALPPVTNYADMVARLTPQQTPEQIEKENRRMRSRRNIAALSDTISAIANLGSTMAGAPSAVEPRQSLSAVSKARWDEMKRERERNSQIYHKAMLRAAQLDESRQRQRQLADYQRQSIALRKEEEARRQMQARLDERKQDWKQKSDQGKLDIQKEKLEIEREYKQGLISLRERDLSIKELNSQTSRMNAETNRMRANQAAGGKTVSVENEYNADGKVVSSRTTTTPVARGGGNRGQQSSTGRRSSGGSSSNSNKEKGNKRKSKTTV